MLTPSAMAAACALYVATEAAEIKDAETEESSALAEASCTLAEESCAFAED
jgi:hypothetical protein